MGFAAWCLYETYYKQRYLRNEFDFLECLWNHEYFGSLAKLLCMRPKVFMIP